MQQQIQNQRSLPISTTAKYRRCSCFFFKSPNSSSLF